MIVNILSLKAMSVSSPIDLEVCVDSLESAIEAVQKGKTKLLIIIIV